MKPETKVDERLPPKFAKLVAENPEVRAIWLGETDDRSVADYRLGHLMFASRFTRDEAASVLVNSQKALGRGARHRVNYALNIIDKIWTFELEPKKSRLSNSVKDILSRGEATLAGIRFPCSPLLDDTQCGFRLGHVIGLVAGSGVGKTAVALNMFRWFIERNPEYDHFFVCLEQTDGEIAGRWKTMCGEDASSHDKVHVLSNYSETGEFRGLSLDDIRQYLLAFQKNLGERLGPASLTILGHLKNRTKTGRTKQS